MSRELVRYLRAREFGHSRWDAAEYAGIPFAEAALIDRDHGFEPVRAWVDDERRVP